MMLDRRSFAWILAGMAAASAGWAQDIAATTGAALPFQARFSGSSITAEFDTNGDGIPAAHVSSEGTSNLGPFTTQEVLELAIVGPAVCSNDKPGVALALVTGSSVTRLRRTGELLYARAESIRLCFDPASGQSFTSGTTRVVGGTGRFAHASGTLTIDALGQSLLEDARGASLFGATTGRVNGTIDLPHRSDDE